ncbi:MAG: hypothetical protein V7752_16740 [Halopseudomonas sp.]
MQNCWEFQNCGRQPDGHSVKELGACPVPVEGRVDGTNKGVNAGRACWAVAGSLCKGEVQGTFANKLMDCGDCKFAHKVMDEQKDNFTNAKQILAKLHT